MRKLTGKSPKLARTPELALSDCGRDVPAAQVLVGAYVVIGEASTVQATFTRPEGREVEATEGPGPAAACPRSGGAPCVLVVSAPVDGTGSGSHGEVPRCSLSCLLTSSGCAVGLSVTQRVSGRLAPGLLVRLRGAPGR